MEPALCLLNSILSTVKRPGFFTFSCPCDDFENVRSCIAPWTPSYQNNLWLKETGKHSLSPALPNNDTVCAATSRSSPTAAKPRFYTYCTSCDHWQERVPYTSTEGCSFEIQPSPLVQIERVLGRFTFHLKHLEPWILMKRNCFPSKKAISRIIRSQLRPGAHTQVRLRN